jgi:2-methylcitrate dehydratase PrpD
MASGEPSLTRQLLSLLSRPVSTNVRRGAALHVLDWAGTVVAAQVTDEARILRRYATPAATGAAHAVGVGPREPAVAAFVNGGLGIVLELDDVHRTARLHPGDVVIPAALACAEATGADGSAFLDAVIRGYEAMVRVGRSVGAGHYRYWHTTSSCGTFGAAAAAGDLLGLDEDTMVHALGNAGTQSAGLWQCRPEHTMSKVIHTGRAAQSGLAAAQLAALGLTGPELILEGPLGFYAATCPDADPAELVRPAEGWQLFETSIKPWAACRHAHPAIDAAAELSGRLRDRDVLEVVVRTYPDAVTFADASHPETTQAAKFSIQHAVALVLSGREVMLDQLEHEAREDPGVRDLRDRIRLEVAEPFASAYPSHWGAEVTVRTDDDVLVALHRDALGDPERPMSEEEVVAKAVRLLEMGGAGPGGTDATVEAARDLAEGGSPERFSNSLP